MPLNSHATRTLARLIARNGHQFGDPYVKDAFNGEVVSGNVHKIERALPLSILLIELIKLIFVNLIGYKL